MLLWDGRRGNGHIFFWTYWNAFAAMIASKGVEEERKDDVRPTHLRFSLGRAFRHRAAV